MKRPRGTVALHGPAVVAFFPPEPDLLRLVRSIPGAKYLRAIQGWRVPPSAVERLEAAGFRVEPEVLRMRESPPPDLSGLGRLKVPLYPYQVEGVRFALAKRRVLIADEPGLGKGAQALGFLQVRKDLRPAAIVCPASLKLNWLRECSRFLEDCPENLAVVLSGRSAGEPPRAGIYVVNYDVLADWLPYLRPKAVVGDEAHYVKNPKSVRTKAFRKLCRSAEAVLLLTGTPLMNRPIELFPLLNLLAPEEFPSYVEFGLRYCAGHRKEIVARGGERRLVWDFSGRSNLKELHGRLKSTVMIRRRKAEVLPELPPKRYAVVPLELSDPEAYLKAEREFVAWLAEKVREGVFEAGRLRAALRAEALVKVEYLRLLAALGKLGAALEWIRDFLASGEKLVVFAHHREVVARVARAFPGAAVVSGGTRERLREVDRFQTDPACRLFVGSVLAAGTGLTLTAASNVAVLEFPWRPADLEQAVDRCHRIGQGTSVTAWCLVATVEGAKSIDERVLELLLEKRGTALAAVDGAPAPGREGDVFEDLVSSFSTA